MLSPITSLNRSFSASFLFICNIFLLIFMKFYLFADCIKNYFLHIEHLFEHWTLEYWLNVATLRLIEIPNEWSIHLYFLYIKWYIFDNWNFRHNTKLWYSNQNHYCIKINQTLSMKCTYSPSRVILSYWTDLY